MNFNQLQNMRNEPLHKPQEYSLAMAYVPVQPQISKVYSPEAALQQGTLFPELDKPFVGKRGVYYG